MERIKLDNDTRSIKSSKTLISNFAQKTFSLILTFVSRTVFIHVFGVELLGINGLFSNVISLLSLADLGFSTAMTYSYYKPVAENDYDKIAALNRFYKKVYLIIAAGITLVGLALIPFLDQIVNLPSEVDNLYVYYLLTLAGTVVSYLFVYKTTVLYAYQQGYVVAKYNMIVSAISMIVQIIGMLLFKNYILYLGITVAFNLINNLYISHVTDKRFPFIKKKIQISKTDKKDIFSNLGSVFIYKVSSTLMNGTTNIIISKLVGTITVGFYSNYLTVINMISGYVTLAFNSLTASIGNVIVKDSKEKQFHLFKEIQIISAWFCIVISSCVYVLINNFIEIWIGTDFLLDEYTVLAIGVNFFLTCILNPIWIFREAAGIYRKTKYIMLICAVLNIGLAILLGHYFGLCGILFASAISKLLTYIWYEPIILFKDFFNSSPIYFFGSSLIILAVTVLVSAILSFIQSVIPVDGILGFIVKGVCCFIIANLIYLVIYCKNKNFASLLNRIKNMVLPLLNSLLRKK